MINTLDSRALRIANCYGQRFMKAGDYNYDIVPAYGAATSVNRPFMVRVEDADKDAKMKQHYVQIRLGAGRFSAPAEPIVINVGDMVMWNCKERDAPPYAIVGDREFFNSSRLLNESGFSHAFGTAGEYPWVDAYGSGVKGIVRVKDPKFKDQRDIEVWQKSLAKGTLVTITDKKVTPSEVEIMTGQTVFFVITKCNGISITEARLLDTSVSETGKDKAASPAGRASQKVNKPLRKAKSK